MLQNCLQELRQSNAFPIQLGHEHIFSTVTVQNAKKLPSTNQFPDKTFQQYQVT